MWTFPSAKTYANIFQINCRFPITSSGKKHAKTSQDAGESFEEKHEPVVEIPKPEPLPKISAEAIKKKQTKKDEDPKIARFKNAEVNVSKLRNDFDFN